MFIWKIFVIIMSVTSLTLVNVNSSSDSPPSFRPPRRLSVNMWSSNIPSYADTPRSPSISTRNSANVVTSSDVTSLPSRQRPPRGGYAIVNPSDALNSSRQSRERGSSSANVNYPDNPSPRAPRQSRSSQIHDTFFLYNQETETTYPTTYNARNPLKQGTFGHKCYQQISVFCDIDIKDLESNNCIMRAILLYKYDLLVKNDDDSYEYLLSVVRTYFDSFPINAEKIPLPMSFCRKKAAEALVSLEENEAKNQQLIEYAKCCIGILNEYQEFIPKLSSMEANDRLTALRDARYKIAHYALNSKTTLQYEGMYEENLELSYLHEISKTVTSRDADHKPSLYCKQMEIFYKNLTQNGLD